MSPFHSLALLSFSRLAHTTTRLQHSSAARRRSPRRTAPHASTACALLNCSPRPRCASASPARHRNDVDRPTPLPPPASRNVPAHHAAAHASRARHRQPPPPSSSCLIEHPSHRLTALHSSSTSIGRRPRAAHPRRRRRCLHAPPSCLVVPHSPHLDHRRARQHVPVRRRPLVVVVVVARPRATPLPHRRRPHARRRHRRPAGPRHHHVAALAVCHSTNHAHAQAPGWRCPPPAPRAAN